MNNKKLLAVAVVAILVVASLAATLLIINGGKSASGVSAVRDNAIYWIPSGTLTISPKMVGALENLAYWIHPELFTQGANTTSLNVSGDASDASGSSLYIVDDRGVNITFTSSPQRIVSLGSSFTDIIVSLGGGSRIVGVDQSSASVSNVSGATNLGQTSSVSIESLLALTPDVVFIWNFGMYGNIISNMESNGLNVVSLYPKTVSDGMNTMDRIGSLIGGNATQLVDTLQDRMNTVINKTQNLTADQKPRVYLELATYGGQTVSNGTLSNELIKLAGGTNIFANGTGNWKASTEWIIQKDPQVIVFENSSSMLSQQKTELESLGYVWPAQTNVAIQTSSGVILKYREIIYGFENTEGCGHLDL